MKLWMSRVVAFTLVMLMGTGAFANRVGIGVGLEASNIFFDPEIGAVMPKLYFPVQISKSLILEPAFSLIRVENIQYLALSGGLLFGKQKGNTFGYGGVRAGLRRVSYGESDESGYGESKESDHIYFASFVGGGEYSLSENFSLGVEGKLTSLFSDGRHGADSLTFTSSEFIARYYF
jgi:hypothetical protein